MKTERILSILSILVKNEWTTAPDLAKKLSVTSRTIWRDIDQLNRAGFPIITRQGVGGGISLPAEFRQRRGEISDAELEDIIAIIQNSPKTAQTNEA
ncbi:MAG: HTH domain-containing protein [Eubacteriaceae bacterium]|nr:HTH domain-containing protein [Eubacteriaceae bacterium]